MKNPELRNAQSVRQVVRTMKTGERKPALLTLWEDQYQVPSYRLLSKWKSTYTGISLGVYILFIVGFLAAFYYAHSAKGVVLATLILAYVLIVRIISSYRNTFTPEEVVALKSLDSVLEMFIHYGYGDVARILTLNEKNLKNTATHILTRICARILECERDPTPQNEVQNKIIVQQAKRELEITYKGFENFGLALGGYTEYYRKAGCLV